MGLFDRMEHISITFKTFISLRMSSLGDISFAEIKSLIAELQTNSYRKVEQYVYE